MLCSIIAYYTLFRKDLNSATHSPTLRPWVPPPSSQSRRFIKRVIQPPVVRVDAVTLRSMPPIRTKTSRNLIEQEGRILLAIQVIKKQEISTICEAVRDIPKSTLCRLDSTPNRAETRANETLQTLLAARVVLCRICY